MSTSPLIRTAVLLAAGTGSRLSPLTDSVHKCLTEVNGIPILQQQVSCLEHWEFDELVVVVGHRAEQVQAFLESCQTTLRIRYVYNAEYATTNNLYSLWLARDAIKRPFLLLECDLFFRASVLAAMREPDRIAIAVPEAWMNGTTVTSDESGRVRAFVLGKAGQDVPNALKTVNIYSLSLATWEHVVERLGSYVSKGKVNDYYEAVFADLAREGRFNPLSVIFDNREWYEIDTVGDLRQAERVFENAQGGVSASGLPRQHPPATAHHHG